MEEQKQEKCNVKTKDSMLIIEPVLYPSDKIFCEWRGYSKTNFNEFLQNVFAK